MNYTEMQKETLKAEEELLDQYKTELLNLQNGTGLAKTMSNSEIRIAIAQLEAAILTKELAVKSIEELIAISEAQDREFAEKMSEIGLAHLV